MYAHAVIGAIDGDADLWIVLQCVERHPNLYSLLLTLLWSILIPFPFLPLLLPHAGLEGQPARAGVWQQVYSSLRAL